MEARRPGQLRSWWERGSPLSLFSPAPELWGNELTGRPPQQCSLGVPRRASSTDEIPLSSTRLWAPNATISVSLSLKMKIARVKNRGTELLYIGRGVCVCEREKEIVLTWRKVCKCAHQLLTWLVLSPKVWTKLERLMEDRKRG